MSSGQHEFGYDDRKTLLDVYYDGGGHVGLDTGLALVYGGLIAVANHAVEHVRADTLKEAAEDFYTAAAAGVEPILNRAAGDILMRRAKAGTPMPKPHRPALAEGASE